MLTEQYFKDNSSVEPYEKSPFWTLLGDADDLEKIPFHHREQLLFLNRISSDFVYQYIEDLKIVHDKLWEPFVDLNYQKQEKFTVNSDFKAYKKWLYNRGIPFATSVLVLPNYNSHPMLMTWKMLLKYIDDIFGTSDDLLIFDFSQTWFLFHYHDGETTFVSNV